MGPVFGFSPLPPLFFVVLGAMVATYLVMVETIKVRFYRAHQPSLPLAVRPDRRERLVRRWSARWTVPRIGRAEHAAHH